MKNGEKPAHPFTLDDSSRVEAGKSIPVRQAYKECDTCGGFGDIWRDKGEDKTPEAKICPICNGEGKLPVTPEEVRKPMYMNREDAIDMLFDKCQPIKALKDGVAVKPEYFKLSREHFERVIDALIEAGHLNQHMPDKLERTQSPIKDAWISYGDKCPEVGLGV